jgi:hypothetical protein
MATRRKAHSTALIARADQPLIGVVLSNEDESVAYFADEASADAMLSQRATQRALAAIGAWSHLDWDEVEKEIDRIRHESRPTPPIEDL